MPASEDRSESEAELAADPLLADGMYDVLVVDITIEDSAADNLIEVPVAIEIVITAGPQKGHVTTVEFSAAVTEAEALEALGLPGTLVVENGLPQLQLDEPSSR